MYYYGMKIAWKYEKMGWEEDAHPWSPIPWIRQWKVSVYSELQGLPKYVVENYSGNICRVSILPTLICLIYVISPLKIHSMLEL